MKLAIKKATTDVTLYVFIADSSQTDGRGLTSLAYNSASLVASYVRPLGSRTAITLATQTVTGTHSDGGFVEVDATNMPGVYRLDLPDAVCATGVNSVVVMLKGASNMAPVVLELELVAYDPQDAVRLGLTALPNAAADAAGGLPISDAGGLDLDTLLGRLDAAITTRLAAASYTAPLDAAGTRSAVGLASADLDTQLAAIAGYIDTEVAAIKAVTDNLPDSGALTSLIADIASILTDTGTALPATLAGLATASALATLATRLTGTVVAQGTIGATGNDTTHLHLSGLTYGDDEINNYLLVILDVSTGEYHARYVEDWSDTGDLATVATLPFTPQDSTDTYWLLPFRQDVTGGTGLDAAGVRAAVGLASANLDTQLAALPTAGENADAVWEEAVADHSGTTGSTAEALGAAGSAGDPWVTALPGAYGSGSAGKIVGDALTGHTPQTGDSYARIGAPAGASVSADVAAVKADTATLLGRITSSLFAGMTSLAQWLGALAGKQTANSTARTEIRATGAGSGTYDETTDSQEALRDRGDAAWITATGFSTHSAADVWAVGTRTLTAGTNIVLAKGVGITGFNDLSAAQVNAEADTALADYDGPTRAEATADKDEILAAVATVDTVVDAIKAVTDVLPDAGALDDLAAILATVDSVTYGNAALKTLIDTLDTVADAVKAKTDNLPASPAATGDAMTLTSGERDAVAAAILDLADSIETNVTVRLALRYIAATTVGTSANDGKTFKSIGGSTNRVTATMSGKDRTGVTLS